MLAVGAGQLVIPKAAMARANSRSVLIPGAGWIHGRRDNPLLTMHGTHESGVVAANILLAGV